MDKTSVSALDIRRVCLTKSFQGASSSADQPCAWHVFGWYDSMEIQELELDKNPRHAFEHIYADALALPLTNPGNQKLHALYGIGAERREAHQAFWKKAQNRPLLFVSLVHFHHPLGGPQDDGKNVLAAQIRSVREALPAAEANPPFEYSIYYSMECNDLLIFWSASSIHRTIEAIARLAARPDLVGEIFTIHSCRLTDMERIAQGGASPLESPLGSVRVHLRSSHFDNLLQKTSELMRSLISLYPNLRVARHIIPGQDDIILAFQDIPLPLFFRLYCKPSGEADAIPCLDGFMTRPDIITRTVIDSPIPAPDGPPPGSDRAITPPDISPSPAPDGPPPGHCVPALISAYREALNSLNELEAYPSALSLWITPLQELLVEFAGIECGTTGYDIYRLSVDCHKRFVEEIVSLLKAKNPFLLDPNSVLVSKVQKYLRGWSQLSFHAMHAEWQLTQTSDINRLYLFPAKLYRLYATFMQQSSLALDYTDHPNHASIQPCRFFLVPTICTNATFDSIFRRSGVPHSASKLVLGEIPANLIFSPQILLPTLVHEAAHYSGHHRFQRELRYRLLLRSVFFFILRNYLTTDYLLETQNTKDRLMFRYITELEELTGPPKDFYIDTVRGHILNTIINMISADELEMRGSGFAPGLYDEPRFGLPKESLAERRRRSAERIRSNANVFLSEMMLFSAPYSIENYLDTLIRIYRETYADFCMVSTLAMTLPAYLNVAARMKLLTLQGKNKLDDSDKKHLREWMCYERCMVIVEYFRRKQGAGSRIELLRQVANDTSDNAWKMVSPADKPLVCALAEELIEIENEWLGVTPQNPEIPVWQSPFSRGLLNLYLSEVEKRWEHANQPDPNDPAAIKQSGEEKALRTKLRNVYQTLSPQFGKADEAGKAGDVTGVLKSCIDLMKTRTET